jgi:hypothetical protein
MKFFLTLLFFAANTCYGLTGNEWLDLINSDNRDDKVAAMSYMHAMTDGMAFHNAVVDPNNALEMNICAPDGVTVAQTAAVFKKYLTDNPGKRHFRAYGLAYMSLIYEWPCNKNRRSKLKG